MRKLYFLHCKKLEFDTPVISHSFSLRLVPTTDSRQIICDLKKDVTPTERLTAVTDEWGTTMWIGDCYYEHDTFSYSVSGIAWVKNTPYIEGPLHPIYRYSSELTHPGKAIEAIYAGAEITSADPVSRAQEWMHLLYNTMTYEKGATNVHTTAEEAAALGKGVCQNYTQLMIALCRRDGIPARYVVGYLYGEGETHAWIEIFDGKRWCGLDPTNNCMINSGYVCLTRGRDYNDCILDKGFFRIPGYEPHTVSQNQTVNVTVRDL